MLGMTLLFNYHIRFLNNGKYKGLPIFNNMLFFKDNSLCFLPLQIQFPQGVLHSRLKHNLEVGL